MPITLAEISKSSNIKLRPAGWAFAIWGIIYALLASFTLFQALPTTWIKDNRSDDFIFNKIGWLFSFNLILNAAWLPTFMSNSVVGFVFAWIIITVMLITALIMERKAVTNNLKTTEIICFRCGMSIYAGWLFAATIVSGATML